MSIDNDMARAALLDAADLIEREGWVQGVLGLPGMGYCALGALGQVTKTESARYFDARDLLARSIGISPFSYGGIPAWNDREGQTKEQVLQTLRRAAKP